MEAKPLVATSKVRLRGAAASPPPNALRRGQRKLRTDDDDDDDDEEGEDPPGGLEDARVVPLMNFLLQPREPLLNKGTLAHARRDDDVTWTLPRARE